MTFTWSTPRPAQLLGEPAPSQSAALTRLRMPGGTHDVYTHPSGDCTEGAAVLVGNTSPVTYTVTAGDVTSGSITFACDLGSHCESGMIQTFTVNRDCVGAWSMGEGDCTADCETRTYTVSTAASGGGTACGVADGTTTDCQPGMVRQAALSICPRRVAC